MPPPVTLALNTSKDWRVFIDGNQDGDFDDAGELVLSVDDATYIWQVVNLPANTLPGATTLRIVMGFYINDDPCQNYFDGEIEDYILVVNNNYCAPYPVSTAYEYIQSVYLNEMGNVSGDNGGYADFPYLSTDLYAGGFYSINLTPGFKYGPYTENWSVFIDFNQNGNFDDAGELVTTGSSSGLIALGFSVPTDAVPGKTRLRVVMSFGATAGSCPSNSEGEVEDYRVIIENAAMRPEGVKEREQQDLVQLAENNRQRQQLPAAADQLRLSAYPNPSNATFTVEGNWTDATRISMSILNASGQTVRSLQHDNPAETQVRIDLGDQPDGVYFPARNNRQGANDATTHQIRQISGFSGKRSVKSSGVLRNFGGATCFYSCLNRGFDGLWDDADV
ncbi:MAG: T9SS type A sorting domain-containing protein [Saprospiraceae bacterium]|nr:T9SS type A sorting domain-containing protein [Saprospiraceae bacterium]